MAETRFGISPGSDDGIDALGFLFRSTWLISVEITTR